MVTVFKENMNCSYSFHFNIIVLTIEAVFISEQNTDYRFEALLKISNKFTLK